MESIKNKKNVGFDVSATWTMMAFAFLNNM